MINILPIILLRLTVEYLLTETSGKQYVLWTRDCRCFPQLRLRKHRQSLVHKTYCFPRSQSISVNCSNYQAISILSAVSKIFEKIVPQQLYTYSNGNKIITSFQSGFRKGYSTSSALLNATNSWLVIMNRGLINDALFPDLIMPLTRSITIYLLKRLNYEIKYSTLLRFISYLSNRTQHVKYRHYSII